MKKRVIALLLCMTTALSFGACGKDNKQTDTQESASEVFDGKSSASMDID